MTGGEGGTSHEMRDGVIHGGAKGGWKGLEARGGERARGQRVKCQVQSLYNMRRIHGCL